MSVMPLQLATMALWGIMEPEAHDLLSCSCKTRDTYSHLSCSCSLCLCHACATPEVNTKSLHVLLHFTCEMCVNQAKTADNLTSLLSVTSLVPAFSAATSSRVFICSPSVPTARTPSQARPPANLPGQQSHCNNNNCATARQTYRASHRMK